MLGRGKGYWINHPELVKLRRRGHKKLIEEVKHEMKEIRENRKNNLKRLVEEVRQEMQDKNSPRQEKRVRVIRTDKPFRPAMTIRINHEVVPLLSETRP